MTIYAKVGTMSAQVVWALRIRTRPVVGQKFMIRELTQGAKPEPVLCREIKVLPDGHEGTPLYFLERF